MIENVHYYSLMFTWGPANFFVATIIDWLFFFFFHTIFSKKNFFHLILILFSRWSILERTRFFLFVRPFLELSWNFLRKINFWNWVSGAAPVGAETLRQYMKLKNKMLSVQNLCAFMPEWLPFLGLKMWSDKIFSSGFQGLCTCRRRVT